MGIVRFDPFRELNELDRIHREMNRLFEGVSGNAPDRAGLVQGGRLWSPSVDVADLENEIVLRAELPGMKQEEIDIELTGDTLTIRGERKFENEDRKENFVRVERSYGRFQRSFTVGVPVKGDEVSASYKDGILEIRLPKSEENKPRKIGVTVG